MFNGCSFSSGRSAARQHPQRSPAHHHPHGHLCLPARPAAVAERDPPGHRENAASHPVIPPGIHHPGPASVLPVLPSGTRHPGAAPDPAGSPLRYPPCHRLSGPARFSPPVPAVLPPLPAAAGDALRMRVRLFTHLCPCCITWLHRDVASSSALAGCWKSLTPSLSRQTPGAPGLCPQQTRPPPKSQLFGEADPAPCAESIPGECREPGPGWHKNLATLGTLSEEQLHVLSHTTSTFCFLVNSGPCLNADSWGLDGAWSKPGVVGGVPVRAGGRTG